MIIDTTSPTIVAPSDLQIEAIHIEQNIVDLTGVRVSDQVEVSSITNDAPAVFPLGDRKSTRLNSSHSQQSRMPSSA